MVIDMRFAKKLRRKEKHTLDAASKHRRRLTSDQNDIKESFRKEMKNDTH